MKMTKRGLSFTNAVLATAICLLPTTVALGQDQTPANSGWNTPSAERKITFNGRSLTATQRASLETLERAYGGRLPDGAYWYDNRTGIMGVWNGPSLIQLPPGMGLGGAMPANCSGGGTGVFVNGRELHVLDVLALSKLGPVLPGRYWVDANGDFGYERGPRLGNLVAIAQQLGQPKQRCFTCGQWKAGDPIVNAGGFLDPKTGYTGPR